jgi:AP-3 complex subunit delta-1
MAIDLKATALLKLIYLEMMGYDMSWASFHVLEVMSSAKYHQKMVGYLGAVQSFRPDTEVLMLATNLLKKVGIARASTQSFSSDTGLRTCQGRHYR